MWVVNSYQYLGSDLQKKSKKRRKRFVKEVEADESRNGVKKHIKKCEGESKREKRQEIEKSVERL